MIYSKSNLQVVDLASKDKDINVLSHVHFNKEGFTAAIDGKAIMVVEPAPEEYKKNFIIKDAVTQDCNLPATGVKEVLRNIPNDSKFKGLLEQVSITKEDAVSVEMETTDGQQIKKVQLRKHRKPFPDIKANLKTVFTNKTSSKICLNRSRLIRLLQAIDKACPDSSNDNPIFIDINATGEIVLRAKNMKTGQIAIGIMQQYEGQWLKKSKWEKEIIDA